MSDQEFESQLEALHREKDALDKLRTDTQRHLRKYKRRITEDGVRLVKAAFTENPNADPEKVAEDALRRASGGQFLDKPLVPAIESPKPPAEYSEHQ